MKYVITLYCEKVDLFEIEVFECYAYWELADHIQTLIDYYKGQHNAEIELISVTKI